MISGMEIVQFFENLGEHIAKETERIAAQNGELDCKLHNLEIRKCKLLRQKPMFEAFPSIINDVKNQSNQYAKILQEIAEKGNEECRILLNAWCAYKRQERNSYVDKFTMMPFHDVETECKKLEDQIKTEENVLEINEISKQECTELHNEYLEIKAQINNVVQYAKEIESDITKIGINTN